MSGHDHLVVLLLVGDNSVEGGSNMAKSDDDRSGQSQEAFWRCILKEAGESELNQTEFCRSKSLSPPTYFWWKRIIKERDAKRRASKKARHSKREQTDARTLIPVRVAESPANCSAPFELVLSGRRVVRIPQDFDVDGLRRLVIALDQC